MNDEIPYALYLKFSEPAESVKLILTLEAMELICLGENKIDEEFSIVNYFFKTDVSKKLVVHVEIENNITERINISIYKGASLKLIKELFSFLKSFDASKTILIDQEIKNDLFIKNTSSINISDDWANDIERQATLPIDFNSFFENRFALNKRNALLGKE